MSSSPPCPADGATCKVPTDCVNDNCTALTHGCNTSGKCASSTCTDSDYCTQQFGAEFACVGGVCIPNSCSSSSPCPDTMTCANGICTSIDCTNSRCPFGMECHKLADGSKVCLARPGIIKPIIILILLIVVLCIILAIIRMYILPWLESKKAK